jgi:hypothetical protein
VLFFVLWGDMFDDDDMLWIGVLGW